MELPYESRLSRRTKGLRALSYDKTEKTAGSDIGGVKVGSTLASLWSWASLRRRSQVVAGIAIRSA